MDLSSLSMEVNIGIGVGSSDLKDLLPCCIRIYFARDAVHIQGRRVYLGTKHKIHARKMDSMHINEPFQGINTAFREKNDGDEHLGCLGYRD